MTGLDVSPKMSLPTAIEINPIPECLDGKCAVEHFEGKTIEQAENLIAENGLYYSGDLVWMGPIGFKFYFKWDATNKR